MVLIIIIDFTYHNSNYVFQSKSKQEIKVLMYWKLDLVSIVFLNRLVAIILSFLLLIKNLTTIVIMNWLEYIWKPQ